MIETQKTYHETLKEKMEEFLKLNNLAEEIGRMLWGMLRRMP